MGRYLNVIDGKPMGTSFKEKCTALENAGAIEVTGDDFLKGLVCVVDNGWMAAAGYAYDEREFKAFKHPCGRPKKWYYFERAEEIAS